MCLKSQRLVKVFYMPLKNSTFNGDQEVYFSLNKTSINKIIKINEND